MHTATLPGKTPTVTITAGDPVKRLTAIVILITKDNLRYAHATAEDTLQHHPDDYRFQWLHQVTSYLSGIGEQPDAWVRTLADVIRQQTVEGAADLEAYLFSEGQIDEAHLCSDVCEVLAGNKPTE